ncbi:ATP-binding cassette domain-containing protein [Enterococcus italicus]|uniref:methionine ABC transporter ATP-binding protein n=1 Tax=Enterococcus italicus TaxID=246144 RepID=UPI00207444CC|nr:ATP-binding cassette domain-containing protein [Enterococcus italicus]MCM6931707.1 ATP-binding cassette domain-containing protein [Enterococcus italicus]
MTNQAKIELQAVSVAFKKQKKEIAAVHDVTLTIEAGEIYGIVGLSGAGKSTLIRTLNLLQRPTAGRILIDGQDITSLKGAAIRDVRKKVGMIFQHFNLISNRTIAQNLTFALKAANYPKEQREARVKEVLQLVDLQDKYHDYPNNLSGGQKQRVGIARAIINNPEILLCDEATSALDVETTEEILKLLAKINRELGITIVFITHELEVAHRLFDRMAVMEDGRVVEEGLTYDVFANPKESVTKRLVGRYFDLAIPDELSHSLSKGIIVELRYQGNHTLDPLISTISKNYPVSIGIIHGKIEYIKEQAIGILLVYVTGTPGAVQEAIHSMQEQVSSLRVVKEG